MEYFPRHLESYNDLRIALETIYSSKSILIELNDNNVYPLLIIESSSDSIGFAIVNKEPILEYAKAYESFKNLYRQNHDRWNEKNLSFVICRLNNISSQDVFYNLIEADIYFCRKYVINLFSDLESNTRELLRLPFLPIIENSSSGLIRPTSAQTFLEGLNVTSQIANQLIVPRETSAKKLLVKLYSEHEKLPTLNNEYKKGIKLQSNAPERTRIKSVTIQGFRAYNKKEIFETDADIVVFYGQNGLGKTSFFDAIDYACTGRIGHLDQNHIDRKNFIELAKHLGSNDNDGFVEIQVGQELNNIRIKRYIREWKYAEIDGKKYDRANTLQIITSAPWEDKKARIENLENLFRATHLFNQSSPELLKGFEETSTLSPEIVSRMLALDDYQSGLAKTKTILDQIEKDINSNKAVDQENSVKLSELDKRINEYKRVLDPLEPGENINDLAKIIIKTLEDKADYKINNTEPTTNNSREWRSIVESLLNNSEDDLALIEIIQTQFIAISSQIEQHKANIARLAEMEANQENKVAEKITVNSSLLKQRFVQIENLKLLTELKYKLTKMYSLVSEYPKYLRTIENVNKIKTQIENIRIEKLTYEKEVSDIENLLNALETKYSSNKTILLNISSRVDVLNSLSLNVLSFNKNEDELSVLENRVVTIEAIEADISKTIETLDIELSLENEQLKALENIYNEWSVNNENLTKLLDEIEVYVVNETCPTCGYKHFSKEILLEKIRENKQLRPSVIEETQRNLTTIRESIKIKNNSKNEYESRRQNKIKDINELKTSIK